MVRKVGNLTDQELCHLTLLLMADTDKCKIAIPLDYDRRSDELRWEIETPIFCGSLKVKQNLTVELIDLHDEPLRVPDSIMWNAIKYLTDIIYN